MHRTFYLVFTVFLVSVSECIGINCTSGTYFSGTTCIMCPSGTWSASTGATSVSECIVYTCTIQSQCPTGMHSDEGASVCVVNANLFNSSFSNVSLSNSSFLNTTLSDPPVDNTVTFVVIGTVVGVVVVGGLVTVYVLTQTQINAAVVGVNGNVKFRRECARDYSKRIEFFKTTDSRVYTQRSIFSIHKPTESSLRLNCGI